MKFYRRSNVRREFRFLPAAGKCLKAEFLYGARSFTCSESCNDARRSHREKANQFCVKELQELGCANLQKLKQQILKAEEHIKSLKRQILLNKQSLSQLMAYRLLTKSEWQ